MTVGAGAHVARVHARCWCSNASNLTEREQRHAGAQGHPAGVWHSPSVRTAFARVDPVLMVLIGIATVQLGAAFAKDLFATTTPSATAWLRLCFSSLIFLTFARPRVRSRRC